VKIDAVKDTPHFTGGGINKFHFLPSEFILSIWVKFGTRDPHQKLSSNCEFVENLPVEVLVVCNRTNIITLSYDRSTASSKASSPHSAI